jgi:hypothetical protein
MKWAQLAYREECLESILCICRQEAGDQEECSKFYRTYAQVLLLVLLLTHLSWAVILPEPQWWW